MKKIGIYGGTFSPPHLGHVEAARAFLRQLSLDELLIIPTATPPHKEYEEEASADERIEMCKLAFSGIERTTVSDMEIRRGGKSYTYLTLEELDSEDTELYFLCGTDMILTFDLWRNFKRIFELATVCFARRERDASSTEAILQKVREYRELYGAKIIEINHRVIEVSSTDIRRLIESGQELSMLPLGVADFIRERGLYK